MSSRREENQALLDLFAAKARGDIAYLVDALRDPKIRFMAVKFLGDLRAEEAVQPLIRLLRAGDRVTRSSAAGALAEIGATEAIPELVERARLEEDIAARTWAITALGELGDERAVEPLCNLLLDDSLMVRVSVVNALGMLGYKDAIGPLGKAAAKERWYARRQYRKAIRKIRARIS